MDVMGWVKERIDIMEEVDEGLNMEVVLKLSPGVVGIDIMKHDRNIGYMELSVEDCPFNEDDQTVEVRNIEIKEQYRGKGYSRKVIDKIKTAGLPITGCVTEEEHDNLSQYWEHMGAQFINDTEFMIK